MVKRVSLFLLVNFLILMMVGIVWELIQTFFGIRGSYIGYIATFSLVLGMGGAFVSLWMSKFMAKHMMGVQVIDPRTAQGVERELVEIVHDLARKARLPKMPEVGIYNSPEVNAFATGPSKSNALVAVSSGLLQRFDREQVEGVLGHEIAHIANGDMVTMTLLQGVINALVLFLARVLAHVIASQGDRDRGYFFQFILIIVFQAVFGLLGALVVNYFSRHREFRADAGGAKLAGRQKMIEALKALQRTVDLVDAKQEAIASLKISGRSMGSVARLFATHPPLEERIRRLERMNIS
ncbi:MAG: protease HtpX [Bdellovibrio sp.]|nr:MAG: protease HtpX [Bdellovibrio sp.]